MTNKSNRITTNEDFWNQCQSSAFTFDDIDVHESYHGLEDSLTLESNESIHTSNTNQTKSSDLEVPQSLVQNQIQKCLNQIQSQQKTITHKMCPKEVITCLSKGIDMNLYEYKGKEEKVDLLDNALHTNDGNIITSVVLYLKRTIKANIFNYEISKRCLAADHYLFYLRQNQRTDELMDTLSMLGRHEEAAITAYTQAMTCVDISAKIQNLKNCLRNHFTSGGNDCIFWSNHISEQISLLEQQLPIESDDRRQERNGINHMFNQMERKCLIEMSVISTLYYCSLYHYCLPENHFASPKAIKNAFQLSEKQFVWTALSALAKSQQWLQIDALFEYKSWLGNKRIKSLIPFDKVVILLHRNSAPHDMLSKYLHLIDDFDIKFNLAKDIKLLNIAIDPLIKANDRKRLEEVSTKLDINSEHYVYVQNAILSIGLRN